jgi:predicted AAA+ superfamily ATPase
LGIENEKQLATHYLKGGLFETFVLAEFFKHRLNRGLPPNCYFWRDKQGHEIDCLLEQTGHLIPIEIKAGKTVVEDYFKEIKYWQELSGGKPEHDWVVYGGEERQKRTYGQVTSWKNVDEIL